MLISGSNMSLIKISWQSAHTQTHECITITNDSSEIILAIQNLGSCSVDLLKKKKTYLCRKPESKNTKLKCQKFRSLNCDLNLEISTICVKLVHCQSIKNVRKVRTDYSPNKKRITVQVFYKRLHSS